MPRDHERFTVRVSDEAVQAAQWLQDETGLSRSKIVDTLLCKAGVEDLEEVAHKGKVK